MNKKIQDCLAHKTRLIEEIKQMTDVKKEELSAYVYQLDQLVGKMRTIANEHTFRSRNKERIFYEQTCAEGLIYYWYVRELAQFYCGFPVNPANKATYAYERMQAYQNYITIYFPHYTAFCASELSFDYTELQAYLVNGDSLVSCCFFNEKFPFLYPIYFSALQLVINHIETLVLHCLNTQSQPTLPWKRSKLDLCLVVYAVYLCNKIDYEKSNLIEWAKTIGNLFDLEISKNFFQTIGEFKKRKDISANFVAEMQQVIIHKCDDSE